MLRILYSVSNRKHIDYAFLVKETKKGNRDAMGLIYTHFAPRMVTVIRRYIANSDDVYDILHDGFLVAFTRIETLKDPQRLEQWLATIMKNLSLKYIQSEASVALLNDLSQEKESEDTEHNEIIPDFETLQIHISKLPAGYQTVFKLAMLEHKSHKEISEILGIAPNSSSSQLFHAKQQLRKLINDYRYRISMLTVLLLAVSSGLIYLIKNSTGVSLKETNVASYRLKQPDTSFTSHSDYPASSEKSTSSPKESQRPVRVHKPSVSSKSESPVGITSLLKENEALSEAILTTDSISKDITTHLSDKLLTHKDPITRDTITVINTQDIEQYPMEWTAFNQSHLPHSYFIDKGWNTGIEVDPGIANFNSIDNSDFIASPGDISDNLYEQSHHNDLPISVALTAERSLTSLIGIETGIGYSYLHSTFEGPKATTDCHWHYLNVPLKINLYAYTAHSFSIYGSVCGAFHIPVYSNADVHVKWIKPDYESGRFNSKPIWSLGGSLGFSIRLTKRLDIYVEPTLHYHFPNSDKVPNIWIDEPWGFSVPIGIRLKW